MLPQRLFTAGVAGAMLCISAPALAEDVGQLSARSYRIDQAETQKAAMRWEIGYQLLSAVDLVQTISWCAHHNPCEGNPVLGKHPSPEKLIALKLVGGAAHFMLLERLSKRNPKAALRVAQVSFGLQGAVVGLNFKTIF
jgi:hypothetical protein